MESCSELCFEIILRANLKDLLSYLHITLLSLSPILDRQLKLLTSSMTLALRIYYTLNFSFYIPAKLLKPHI